MSTDLITYLRRYRPDMTREEVAIAAGISVATLTRRLREGLDADEVIRASQYVGASPTEALMELGMLAPDDVQRAAGTSTVEQVAERVLIEELLSRAYTQEAAVDADREEAGIPRLPPRRYSAVEQALVDALPSKPEGATTSQPRADVAYLTDRVDVSVPGGMLADAADDTPAWQAEDEEREQV